MNVNDFVKRELRFILKKYNFVVYRECKNWIEFSSKKVKFSISYNELDKECLFMIGLTNDELFQINDKMIKEVFNSNLRLETSSIFDFMDKLILFITLEGDRLLKGDEKLFKEMYDYWRFQNKSYTHKIINDGYLFEAGLAWETKRYDDFIYIIDKVDESLLTPSLLLKYRIAKEKVKL